MIVASGSADEVQSWQTKIFLKAKLVQVEDN